MTNSYKLKTASVCLVLLGCSPTADNNTPSIAAPNFVWTHKSPETGFVSSVKFHPSRTCEVWASGDDMSGVYKSVDCGQNWSLVPTAKNVSTYSLTFDPTNPNVIYAANHFGFGMLKSTNGGSTWTLSQAGLPTTVNNRRLFQTAINPNASSTVIVAAQDGLYRSVNAGTSFSKLSIAWGSAFMAAVYTPSGRLVAGATNGVFKFSDDNGFTWSDLLTASLPIVEMQVSQNALYVLYAEGTLQYFDLPNFGSGGTLNVGSTDITTDVLATLTVVSGASRATDTLYLGTSKKSSVTSTRWGLFKSVNGGANWNQLSNGLNNISIFRIAVDPNNSSRVLVASSSSGGILTSTDGGASFTRTSSGIMAVSALGFAQNPLNPNELVLSSSVGLGMSQTYHSTDGGTTWAIIGEVNGADGSLSWSFDPQTNGTLLVGMIGKGVYRSTTGVGGPFTRVVSTDTKVSKIVREPTSSNIVYSLALEGTVSSDVRVYYSSDSGATFTIRPSLYAADLAPHPTNSNEAIAVSVNDAFASSNGFATRNSLNLSTQATAQKWLECRRL